jgi:cytoskeletal protein RodZ
MKKVVTTLTAVAFALGIAGAGMAQSVAKDAEKPAAKTEMKVTQSQVAPKSEKPGEAAKPGVKEEVKPGETAKPAAKEDVKPGEKAKPVTKEVPKAGEKGKETAKKTTMPEKKVEKKSETPVEKPVK